MIKSRLFVKITLIVLLLIPFGLVFQMGDSAIQEQPVSEFSIKATADAFEDDDTFETASTIALNAIQERSIYPIADPDFIVFELDTFYHVTIEIIESVGDTRMWLYDYNRTQIMFDDNTGDNLNASISFDYLKPGIYFIKIDENGNDAEIDAYSVSITATITFDPYEYDGCPSPTLINFNSSITKSIYPVADHDYFTFTIVAQYNITIETFGTGGDTVIDVRTVCDEDITIIDYNDDKGDGTLFSKLTFINLDSGSYYIKVYGYDDIGDVLNYTLQLTAYRSGFSDTTNPSISGISHTLSEPIGPSGALVNATIHDTYGISEAYLHYRVNSGGWNQVKLWKYFSGFTTEYLYLASIGPFNENDFVEYYFTAEDASSNHNEQTSDNGGSYYSYTIMLDDADEPVIDNVLINPSVPTDAEAITINCTVTDASPLSSVDIYYRINSSAWVTVGFVLQTGSTYQVSIGPFGYNDLLEFYLNATDNSVYRNIAIDDNSGEYYTFTIISGDFTPPAIISVSHDIEYPRDIEPVNVTCIVTDVNGISSVQLVYRIQGGTWNFVFMSLLQGNTYFVILGPFALGSFVEYFIQATDNSPNQNQGINSNEGDFFSFHVDPFPTFPTFPSKLFMVPILLAITSLIFIRKKK